MSGTYSPRGELMHSWCVGLCTLSPWPGPTSHRHCWGSSLWRCTGRYWVWHVMSAWCAATVTSYIDQLFTRKANYDLRPMLAGSEKFLHALPVSMDRDFSHLLQALPCLPLDPAMRTTIGQILFRNRVCNVMCDVWWPVWWPHVLVHRRGSSTS